MKLNYFGDSYDIVKKSLISWLWDFGPWSTHPMFTELVSSEKAAAFSRFLGVQLIFYILFTCPVFGEYHNRC